VTRTLIGSTVTTTCDEGTPSSAEILTSMLATTSGVQDSMAPATMSTVSTLDQVLGSGVRDGGGGGGGEGSLDGGGGDGGGIEGGQLHSS